MAANDRVDAVRSDQDVCPLDASGFEDGADALGILLHRLAPLADHNTTRGEITSKGSRQVRPVDADPGQAAGEGRQTHSHQSPTCGAMQFPDGHTGPCIPNLLTNPEIVEAPEPVPCQNDPRSRRLQRGGLLEDPHWDTG